MKLRRPKETSFPVNWQIRHIHGNKRDITPYMEWELTKVVDESRCGTKIFRGRRAFFVKGVNVNIRMYNFDDV